MILKMQLAQLVQQIAKDVTDLPVHVILAQTYSLKKAMEAIVKNVQ